MQHRVPFFGWFALGALCSVLPVAGSAAAAQKVYKPRAPLITVSADLPEMEAAQKRLARFIWALQVGRRAQAASYLSSQVTEAERQGLIQKTWLRADPKDHKNLLQVLYWPDLQIHTHRVYPEAVDLAVVSRSIPFMPKNKKTARPSGILKVRMRKEEGEWRVEMHPPRMVRK